MRWPRPRFSAGPWLMAAVLTAVNLGTLWPAVMARPQWIGSMGKDGQEFLFYSDGSVWAKPLGRTTSPVRVRPPSADDFRKRWVPVGLSVGLTVLALLVGTILHGPGRTKGRRAPDPGGPPETGASGHAR